MTFHSSFRLKQDEMTSPNKLGSSFDVVVIVCVVLDLIFKLLWPEDPHQERVITLSSGVLMRTKKAVYEKSL